MEATGEENQQTKPRCFIAMPIATNKEYVDRYHGDEQHWKHVMDHLLVPAIENAGFDPVTPISTGSDLIHARIIKELANCDLMLCDLSSLNANVFFELGVRTSLNLPIALVAERGTRLPFDTSGINTHFYGPELLVWEQGKERADLSDHIRSSVSTCDGKNPLWSQFGLEIRASEPSASESPESAKLDLAMQEIVSMRDELQRLIPRRPIGEGRAYSDEDLLGRRRLRELQMRKQQRDGAGEPGAPTLLVTDELARAIATDLNRYKLDGTADVQPDGTIIVSLGQPIPDQIANRWRSLADGFNITLVIVNPPDKFNRRETQALDGRDTRRGAASDPL